MIDKVFLKELGLSEGQADRVLDAVQCERVYHSLLQEAGIPPHIALKIIQVTELGEVHCESEDLMRLKISEEWQDFMRKEIKQDERNSLHRL